MGEYRRRRPEQSVLHQAVREGWPKVAEAIRLPPRVHEEVRRYLRCGLLRHGFTVAKCDDCGESQLIAFSCKNRSWCPPHAERGGRTRQRCIWTRCCRGCPFRQWTLSVPFALRFLLMKEPKLLRKVERRLVEAVFPAGSDIERKGWAAGASASAVQCPSCSCSRARWGWLLTSICSR